MRAGLPDRRADAGDAGGRRTTSITASPTARSTACAPIAASAASSPTRSRTTRSSRSTGKDGPANQNRLCVKGRFGFDYVAQSAAPDEADDPQGRRAEGAARVRSIRPTRGRISAKRPGKRRSTAPPAASKKIRDRDGADALAGFGSAKGSNEEAYLFQKLVRTGFGTNNVDHCTRLCHASSVAALLEGVGSAAVTATFNEVQELRAHHRDRRQPDREPSGRRDLLQAGGQARRQARRHGPARHRR